MTRAWTLIAGLLLTAAALAAQDARTDLQHLQGTWTGSLVHIGGMEPTPEEKKLQFKLRIAGDSYQVYEDDMLLMAGTLRLDPAQKMRAIDAAYGDGPLKGMVQKGVYELQGDTFVVNFGKPGDERPRSFQTPAGSEEATIRYTRDKK